MTVEAINVAAETKAKTPNPEAVSSQAPSLEALITPNSSKNTQTLGTAEGNRFTEPFRVASAVVGRVFRAAYALYDNARTDLRVANAAKEMAKLDPTKISETTSAQKTLDAWHGQAAAAEATLRVQMTSFSAPMSGILEKSLAPVSAIKSDVDAILNAQIGSKPVGQYAGEGAKDLQSLSPSEKKAFLEQYKKLEEKLHTLNEIKKSTDQLALELATSSVERFVTQHDFSSKLESLDNAAGEHYSKELSALHTRHLEALEELGKAEKLPTTEQIRAVGKKFTQELASLQQRTEALSSSLVAAHEVEAKVNKTLDYLTKGVDDQKALGAKDESVVFVGEKAADKIADWVKAQTEEARAALDTAKNDNNPAAIETATKALTAASDVVHKQLDDVAALLSKINAGKDRDGKPTDGVRERIIAKATDGKVNQEEFSGALAGYISALNKKMDSLVASMFSDPTSPSVGTGELKKFVAQHHDRVEFMIARDANDGLTSEEVNQALQLAAEALQEKSVPEKNKVELKNEEFQRQADRRVAEIDKQPKPVGLFSRFREWLFSND
jgi:hypothetical protein